MSNNVESFKSKIYNLNNKFFNNTFNIPIYQRLYVWGEEQVKTLLEDLVGAYYHNSKDHKNKHPYFLGGIVVVNNNNVYDLIDGQQRFTTLKILRECLGDKDLHLKFSIRESVWDDFRKHDESDNADIQRMIDAKRLLTERLNQEFGEKQEDKTDFLEYLKNYVNLVVTIVPKNTDLNKLFELINGRGEQLQQHEILKAKILSKISKEQKKQYGKIWDICANIDEHIDISIKKTLLTKPQDGKSRNISWSEYFNGYHLKSFDKILNTFDFESPEGTEINSISEIIKNDNHQGVQDKNIDPDDESDTQYFSIISFPLFLLYTLVSFKEVKYFEKMKDEKIEFKDKNLIKIFERVLLSELIDQDILANKFIKHLFEFREKFDKWVIRNKKKTGDKSNDTDHKITTVKVSNTNKTITRRINDLESSRDLSLLQSMLYHAHTRNTQEWIIPFLTNIENDNSLRNKLELLKNIDNYLYSQIETDKTVLERAYEFEPERTSIDCSKIIEHLIKIPEDYHHFSHYWFYKMDWIIWCSFEEAKKIKMKDFKFTARNSIEHISPQAKDEANRIENTVSNEYSNSFGNLALITVSQNSSFSNKGFLEKMGEFKEKKIPNLKMSLIFDEDKWNDDICKKHLYACLKKIKNYYKDTYHDPI